MPRQTLKFMKTEGGTIVSTHSLRTIKTFEQDVTLYRIIGGISLVGGSSATNCQIRIVVRPNGSGPANIDTIGEDAGPAEAYWIIGEWYIRVDDNNTGLYIPFDIKAKRKLQEDDELSFADMSTTSAGVVVSYHATIFCLEG